MKSRLVSILWPAWEWTFAPGTKYWTASYDNHLAGHLASVSYNLDEFDVVPGALG